MNFLIWMFFVLSSSTSLALSDDDDLPTFSWESNDIEISGDEDDLPTFSWESNDIEISGDDDDLPTFSWESNEIEMSPNLRITFPDGSEDVAVLKEFNLIDQRSFDEEIDPCIFDGVLKFEKDVYVTLTECANTNSF